MGEGGKQKPYLAVVPVYVSEEVDQKQIYTLLNGLPNDSPSTISSLVLWFLYDYGRLLLYMAALFLPVVVWWTGMIHSSYIVKHLLKHSPPEDPVLLH
jgi:hypothetical protein